MILTGFERTTWLQYVKFPAARTWMLLAPTLVRNRDDVVVVKEEWKEESEFNSLSAHVRRQMLAYHFFK